MKQYHFFSIIVPSFNRADELTELLQSIQALDFPRDQFEVIIADDGSTDTTPQVIEQARQSYDFSLHYFTQQRQGPGAARNLGMDKARGDFFIFLDSDVMVPPSWLTNVKKGLEHEQADAFGGPDTYLDSFPALLKAINYSMTSFITTGGLRGKKGKKLAKFYPRSFNMGLSRALKEKIGGFGNLRHGQDIEFSHRIIKSGAKVVFIEDAPVFHKRRTTIKRFFRQVFNWGVARINLFKIDSGMLEPLHALPAAATLFFFTLAALAVFFRPARYLFYVVFAFGILIVFYSMLDAVRKYKQIKPALYLPLIIPIQIFGYGFGFIYNYVNRVILNRDAKIGFYENYYK